MTMAVPPLIRNENNRMTSINLYLRKHLGSVSKNVSVSPDIPEKKLNNAVAAFGYGGSVANVIALYDNTMFGSGKDGLLFTGEQLIYRPTFSSPIAIPFETMQAVAYKERMTGKNLDKSEPYVEIARKDQTPVEIKDLISCDHRKLAGILQKAISEFDEFKDEKQILPIQDMTPELKTAYVKVIINMAFDNDGVIDDKELAEILVLMTRIDMDTPSRMAVRTYMANEAGLAPTAELIATIDAQIPEGQAQSVHISLVKDLINTYFSTADDDVSKFAFFNKHRDLFRVSDAEVELAIDAIRCDRQFLKEDVSDDQIVATLKTLSAKAAAVGTPLAAVYLSGSVIGLSAAGMTSGLATLGMGGMLGMSSMATGIGVAVLIGVGAYVGVRKLTGANELTRFKRRELMLQEVVKLTQSTISMLVQDINFVTLRLNEAMVVHGLQDAKIRKLMALMTQLTGAGAVLAGRSETTQASANKLKCAAHLDEAKLRSLTREASKAELFYVIRAHYEEREIGEADGDGVEQKVKRLVLKSGYGSKELEDLARAFDVLGYFKVGEVLKGAASDAAEKAKEKLAGLFS